MAHPLEGTLMVWARLDDEILDNEKIARVGPLGFALHVAAITWCSRNLSDGFIPAPRARLLFDFGKLGKAADVIGALVAADLWSLDDARGGYWLKDFLDYNPSRAQVHAERGSLSAVRSEAGKRGAEARWGGRRDGIADGSGDAKPDGKAMANGMANRWQIDGPDPVPDQDPPPAAGARAESTKRAIAGPASAVGTLTAPPEDIPVDDDLRGRCAMAGAPMPTREDVSAFLEHARANGKSAADWRAGLVSWMRKKTRYERPPPGPAGGTRILQPVPATGRVWKVPEALK